MTKTNRCDFRSMGECGCHVGSCQQQSRPAAPTVIFSWRQHAAAITFGIVVTLICAGTMHALQKQERQAQIEARV